MRRELDSGETEFLDHGYTSTSLSERGAGAFGTRSEMVEIIIRHGTPFCPIDGYARELGMPNSGEEEVLLPRGSVFRWDGKVNAQGMPIVEVFARRS